MAWKGIAEALYMEPLETDSYYRDPNEQNVLGGWDEVNKYFSKGSGKYRTVNSKTGRIKIATKASIAAKDTFTKQPSLKECPGPRWKRGRK